MVKCFWLLFYRCYGRGSGICFQSHGYYVEDMLDWSWATFKADTQTGVLNFIFSVGKTEFDAPEWRHTTIQTTPPNKKHHSWESGEKKVELGKVGRKCKGHWVNGVREMITIAGWIYILAVSLQLAGAELLIWNYWSKPIKRKHSNMSA